MTSSDCSERLDCQLIIHGPLKDIYTASEYFHVVLKLVKSLLKVLGTP